MGKYQNVRERILNIEFVIGSIS